MRIKFSLSIILLIVLFAANLSARLLIKNVKTTMSFSEFSLSGSESDKCSDIVPLDFLKHLFQTPEDRISKIKVSFPFLEWKVSSSSLNFLYLAIPPPALS